MRTFTGKEYLLLDIANQYGYDRESWDYRLNWVRNNFAHLEQLKDNADSPVLYAKAVRALRMTQAGKPVGHPIGLDATASGLQVLACLSGCERTASAVNLVNTGRREDVYAEVADEMSQQLNQQIERAVVKRPLMTHYYGSTAVPEQAFGKGTAKNKAFLSALRSRMPGAEELMHLFQSFWNPEAKYYDWVMPDGHHVHIPVVKPIKKKIEVDEFHHMTFMYQTSVVTPKKKGRALAANIVHSIDAYVAREMVRRAHAQGFELGPIHDCFYAMANYMNQVRANYLQILSEIAAVNLVEDILSQLSGKTVIYQKHSSDLSGQILHAEYALS
jgi:DNA-directed RNA polymerase